MASAPAQEQPPGPPPAPAAVLPFMPRQLFFYDCDGFGDSGWGCGYRCLQTLLSGVEREPPSFADVVTALNGREGVYADVGDIQVLLQSRYGWGASALLLPVRSEIPHFLARLERLLHDPSNRHPWVILAGGGIIVLISDVDAAQSRFQTFDPHGPLGADESGMGTLPTLGKGGFGWVAAEAGLLGCAEPGIAAALSPDELFMHMNWTALVFDRRPDLPPVPEPPRPPPPPSGFGGGGGGGGGGGADLWPGWGAAAAAVAPAPAPAPSFFGGDGSAWAFNEGGWAAGGGMPLAAALPPLGIPLPPAPAVSRGPYATLPAQASGVYATIPASAQPGAAAAPAAGLSADERFEADVRAALTASLATSGAGGGAAREAAGTGLY